MGDPRIYPGPRQILRYLRIELENRDDGSVWARTPVLPDLLDPGGAMRMGAIAPMCDLVAGTLAAAEVNPDWVATLDFKLHIAAPIRAGHVQARCRPLRVGKNNVVSESRLTDDSGEPVGLALVTFTRLPRRDDRVLTLPRQKGLVRYRLDDEEPRIPLDDYLGLRFAPERAEFELDHHERIYNSFGSIQGGAMGALLERAAAHAAERVFGRPARTLDLHFAYTAQAKVSPFRVTADIVRADADSALSRVQLVDTGQDDRIAAIGTALAVPIDD